MQYAKVGLSNFYFLMESSRDVVFKQKLPKVAEGSPLPNPILTVGELCKNVEKFEPRGAWLPGGFGGSKLQLYLNDGVSGWRPAWIQVTGHSNYGLSLFDESKHGNSKFKRKARTDGKVTEKSHDIQYDADQSPEVDVLNKGINIIVNAIVEKQKPAIVAALAQGVAEDDVKWIIRPLARQRQMRLPYWVNRTNFKSPTGKDICFNDFESRVEGKYTSVFELHGLDATWNSEEKSITIGPIAYGKILQFKEKYIPEEVTLREETELTGVPTEDDMEAALEKANEERERARREKEKEKKEKEKELKAKKKEGQVKKKQKTEL